MEIFGEVARRVGGVVYTTGLLSLEIEDGCLWRGFVRYVCTWTKRSVQSRHSFFSAGDDDRVKSVHIPLPLPHLPTWA